MGEQISFGHTTFSPVLCPHAVEVGQHGESLTAKAGMEADPASIKGVWQGRRRPLCSLSPCLGLDHPLSLQARVTLGLLPSALPVAVSAELRWHLCCGLREEVVEEEGRFPLLL